MMEPAPTKMSAKAPTNSAIDRRSVSPSTNREASPGPGRQPRPPSALALPLRLVLDADRVRDPIDVVEVGNDLDRVVDARVAPALRAHAVDVRRRDVRRLERHLDGEVAQAAQAGSRPACR